METDLHQVIKANDDLTHEHHQFFLYQVRPDTRFPRFCDLSDDRNGSHHKWVPDVSPEPLTTR
jgi:hypothetical protein